MSKRLGICAICLVAVVTLACFTACDRPSQMVEVKLGYVPVGDSAPLYVGQSTGIFAAHKLNVVLQEFHDGSLIIGGAVKGDLDGGSAGITPILNSLAKNAPIKIVADGGHLVDRSKPAVALVVLKNSGIKNLQDLKGSKIAYAAPKTIEDALLSIALANAGMNRSSVTMVPVAQEGKVAVLSEKQVQAALLFEPFVTEAVDNQNGEIILSSQQILPDYQQALIFFSDSALHEKPDVIKNFLEAYREAIQFAQNHPDVARKAIAEKLKPKLTPEQVQTISLLGWSPTVDMERLRKTQKAMVQFGTVPASGDIALSVGSGH